MVNKFEAIGIGFSIMAMVGALYLMRVESALFVAAPEEGASQQAAVVVAQDTENESLSVARAIVDASEGGRVARLIVDDVVIGSGDAVETGDTITVHYIGTLQNGQQFDNSYIKRQPFTFTVGDGKVINGWDEGVLGMQHGGQRIIVVPPHLGYGENGFGPIPGDATLVFAIELLSIQ